MSEFSDNYRENIEANRIVCRHFIVEDNNGTPVIEAAVSEDERPQISLFSAGGVPRLTLGLGAMGQSIIILHGETGTPRLCLSVSEDQTTGINLFDESDVPRVAMGVTKDNFPYVALFDEQGQVLGPDGKPLETTGA